MSGKNVPSSKCQGLAVLLLTAVTVFSPADLVLAQDEGKVVVETHLGSQGVLVPDQPRRRVRPPVVETTRYERGEPSTPLAEEALVRALRSLRRAIEENSALERKVRELNGRIRILEGQRTIEANRLNAVIVERDAYKQKAREVLELKENVEKQLAAIEQEQQTRVAELQKVIEDLTAQLAARSPLPGLPDEALPSAALTAQAGSAEGTESAALKKEVDDLKQQLTQAREELNRIRQSQSTVEDLKTRLVQESRRTERLQEQIKTMRPLADRASRLEEENRELRHRFQWAEQEGLDPETIRVEITQARRLKSDNERLHKEIENLTRDVEAARRQAARSPDNGTETEIPPDWQNELNRLREENQRLVGHIHALQAQWAQTASQPSSDPAPELAETKVNEELARLRTENTRLEAEIQKLQQTAAVGTRVPPDDSVFQHARPVDETATSSRHVDVFVSDAREDAARRTVLSQDRVPAPSAPTAAAEIGAAPDKTLASWVETLGQANSKLRKDEARLHYNRGNTYFHQGRYKEAAREYKEAVRLAPEDAAAHFNLAFVSGEFLYDHQTALKHYAQYLYLNPQAEDAYLVREKILESQMELQARISSPLEKETNRALNKDFDQW